MTRIFVIGIAEEQLATWQEQLLQQCTLIIGAERYSEMIPGFSDRYLSITPLQGALIKIREALPHGKVAILASGDPLFYGIGRRLLSEFPQEKIELFPALSSVQRACALFRIPWDDARITSLHGRTTSHLPGLLLGHAKHLILTDAANSPDFLAGQILDYLQAIGEQELPAAIRMLVAEDIGLSTERITSCSLDEARSQRFSAMNVICLLIPGAALSIPEYRLGLTEEIIHHSRGLITKNEVRAATLHQLRLPETGVLWDVGAGSGSLSIEAARANPRLTVFAIEQKDEELANIKKNIVKFRCFNIVAVPGRAPEALAGLPDPQRVFIGGSGGALPAIIPAVAARLAEGGILVVNGVAQKTIDTAPGLLRAAGFTVQSATVQVSRTDPHGNTIHFNPISIMTGSR
ncbi:MAG: precorrin-6y C5,15-methyltransferase (decarboxylating) subunit CbiE [Desulforhopalus sp.]|nr:precorrin-6y C5,15-methyltransferase (decarboxylating) subunit CbiE [Desulforhopalus sp.]